MGKKPEYKDCPHSDRIVVCVSKVPKRDTNWFTIGKLIDTGAYGNVYVATTHEGKPIIVKVFKGTSSEITNEICYQNIASSHNVAPIVLDYWLCKDSTTTALIAMDFAGNESLQIFFTRIAQQPITTRNDLATFLQIFKALVLLIHHTFVLNEVVGIFHFDLHLKNIIVNIEKGKYLKDLKFIDFGKANNRSDMIKEVDLQICNCTSANKRFDGVQRVFKQLYADRMMPFEFFYDDFIQREYPTRELLMLVYKILYTDERSDVLTLSTASWTKLGKGETVNEAIEHMYSMWIGELAEGIYKLHSLFDTEDDVEEFIIKSVGENFWEV